MAEELTTLEQLLDRIDQTANGRERVSLGTILEGVGSRSFGPLLLLAGVVMLSPLSGIPGMPSTMAVLVLLLAVQLLFHRDRFWLPRWMLGRSVARARLGKALRWLRPPARFVDRWLRPRLALVIQRGGMHAIAVACIFIAASMPVMELVPFTATAAGLVLTAFGLSLIAHDGLLALLAFVLTAAIFGLAAYNLL